MLKRGAQGAMKAVLEVEAALPLNDVGEKVSIKGGVLGQQRCQVEGALGGDQLIEPDHARRDIGPVPTRLTPVLGVGTPVAHGSEDHGVSLGVPARRFAEALSSWRRIGDLNP